jgi:ABC-2 type transport system ATP-binding protein
LRFWRLIRSVASSGKTVFVTTHYMDEAEHCGRIALMKDGKIIALDSPAGLEQSAFPHPIVELSGTTPGGSAWVEAFRHEPGVEDIKSFGMRWHLGVDSDAAWSSLEPKLPPGLKGKVIRPSLEDVFIRLVEEKPKS